MIKYVIFDMDGTILNTLDDITDSVNFALVKCGYAPLDINIIKNYVGRGNRALINSCLPNSDDAAFNQLFKIYCEHYEINKSNKTAPYDGIADAMKQLKLQDYGMAVVSNKYDLGVKQLTSELFGDYISVAIGESASIKPKPEPDGVFAAMKLLGATSGNSVYIGDSEVDYLTANNSGLPFIGVGWGFRSREFLANLGAQYIIDQPLEILRAINAINDQRNLDD